MISRRFVYLAAVLLLSGGISIARAQDTSATSSGSQSGSLGDAARKARAQKKDSSKPAKVFTNDNVGDLKGTISVIGNEPARASGTDTTAENTDDKKPTNGAEAKDAKKGQAQDEFGWRARFAAARKVLADDTKELDILQREFNLKQEQYSQDPNWAMHQQNSREDIHKTQSEIDAKKQDIEKDKQALSDLEDQLRKSGGDAGWANEPTGSSESSTSGSASSGSGAGSSNSGSSNAGAPAPL
jgi:chromosome segregation ATPase